MNKFLKYMAASAIVAAAGLTSCQDDFDNYDFSVPAATLQPNTTIRELKEAMWADSLNYCHQVGLRPDSSHYVIKGTVISSDAAGNLYRTFYIADATAAIAISYNSYDICLLYRPGQEIVVDMTGQFVGKYNGMEEIGAPKWDFSRQYTTTSFMTPRYFDSAVQLNGLPQLSAIDTLTLSTKPLESKESLLEYQGRLVRFNNVTFKPLGGVTTLADAFQSSGYSQPFFLSGSTTDSINVRTSGYSDFWNTQLPTEPCDVVGILGYYNNGSTKDGWQLLLIDPQGLMNVGNPTVAGDKSKPYTVEQAIEAINSGSSNTRAWVQGYVVGTVAPEAASVTGNGDIQFDAPFVLGNTLVIAPSADCRDWKQCMVIELPEASELWAAANLVDNPDVLHQSLAINGRMVANVLGTYGVTGFQGTSADFYIGDLQVPVEPDKGNGSETSPYTVEQVRGLGNPGSNSWVVGYIVGSCPGKDFASGTFTADGASYSNVLLAGSPDETELNNCIPVQLVAQTD
ncbi:MAG: hypothetical protein K2M97_08220, partial [Muribaculaceae bacterium]|nr:hypothetical protein [Muribaculaceae bacterium]